MRLTKHLDVETAVRDDRERDRRCRSVATIILLSPDGQKVCLTIAAGAITDGRRNVSPPQGGIKQYETVTKAVRRELLEELKIEINPDLGIMYLGSSLRVLPKDHPKREDYVTQNYHWVVAYARSWRLEPQDGVAEASWWTLDDAREYAWNCMSSEKAQMFLDALNEMAWHAIEQEANLNQTDNISAYRQMAMA